MDTSYLFLVIAIVGMFGWISDIYPKIKTQNRRKRRIRHMRRRRGLQ